MRGRVRRRAARTRLRQGRAAPSPAAPWLAAGAGASPSRAPALAALLAAVFLGSLASAGASLGPRLVPILEWLAGLACILVALGAAVGAFLAGFRGDTAGALAFAAVFVVAMLLLAGLTLRATDDEEAGRSDTPPPAGAGTDAGLKDLAALLCLGGGIAGLAAAIVSLFDDHPQRALGLALLPVVALSLLAVLAVRGSRRRDGRR